MDQQPLEEHVLDVDMPFDCEQTNVRLVSEKVSERGMVILRPNYTKTNIISVAEPFIFKVIFPGNMFQRAGINYPLLSDTATYLLCLLNPVQSCLSTV